MKNGGITAISPGKTIIRVQSGYNSDISKDIEVEVKEKPRSSVQSALQNEAVKQNNENRIMTTPSSNQNIKYIGDIIIVNKD